MKIRDRANKKNKSSRVSNKKYGDLLKSRSNY